MKNIADIQELHKAGELEAAKKGYFALLKKNPHSAEILHGLGMLLAQEGDFKKAIPFFEKAIQFDANNPIIYLNLANTLKSLRLFSKAENTLKKAIQLDPGYAAALNNLGTVYYAQENYQEAAKYYQYAIEKKSDYIEAYYNLGLALTQLNKVHEAISSYQTLMSYSPDHAAAHFQIARLLLEQNKLSEAENYFHLLEKNYPYHFETQMNLALCYLKQGALKLAKEHFLKALALNKTDAEILFNLGVVCMQLGDLDGAIQYYQRTLQLQPDYFAAHNNLGVVFLAKPHLAFALHHFREALHLQPENIAIKHTVNMLSQDKHLHTSPPEYIQNLFDTYADHYESHLLQHLDYKIPELLLQAIKSVSPSPLQFNTIVDVGCGTGLCGVLFKPFTKKLIGIDLSENMLAIAATKNIYDELIKTDASSYLERSQHQFDLIIAGDVFVYTGELKSVTTAAYHALCIDSLFAFNTEITNDSEYVMNQSGRFSHSKTYLENLAETLGFKVLYYKKVITRTQNHLPVDGHLFVWQK